MNKITKIYAVIPTYSSDNVILGAYTERKIAETILETARKTYPNNTYEIITATVENE